MFHIGSRGIITKVEMEGCDQDFDDECKVHYGGKAVGKLYFKTDVATSKLDCAIYGKIGVWVPFPGGCPVPDGCSVLEQGQCPLSPDDEIIYDMELVVEDFFPPVRYHILQIYHKTIIL